MQARTLTILTVLLDLKYAFLLLLREKSKNPALLNIYPKNGSQRVRSLQFLRSATPEGPLLGA